MVEYLDLIIKIGGAITALGVIVGAVAFFVRLFVNVKKLVKTIEVLEDHSHENYLGIKRLTVMSRDMPIGERIVAGNDYIKAGGNGEVKIFIEKELHTKDVQHD